MNSFCNLKLHVCCLLPLAHSGSLLELATELQAVVVYNIIIMNYVHAIMTGTDLTCSYHLGDLLI